MSLGAFSTICQIKRHDAEKRVRAMAASGWKATGTGKKGISAVEPDDDDESVVDLELLARDKIADLIIRRFKGHGMAVLVEVLLSRPKATPRIAALKAPTKAWTSSPRRDPWDLAALALPFR